MNAADLRERPGIAYGTPVLVTEPGIRPWTGVAAFTKPGATAWIIDVRRDEDGMTWSLDAALVEVVPPDRSRVQAMMTAPFAPMAAE